MTTVDAHPDNYRKGTVMSTDPSEEDNGSNAKFHEVLGMLAAKRQREQEDRERTIGKRALAQLPDHYGMVICFLQHAGLLAETVIDYVDRDMRRIDFAWPRKLVGLRATPCPMGTGTSLIPDSMYSDIALRDAGWLMLTVDPYSPSLKAQVTRVADLVKAIDSPKAGTW